jgi:hypothetical protein
MGMDARQMQAAADRLGVKLEALDLDAEERAVLQGMLGAGAVSVEPAEGEVQGFAVDSFIWFKDEGGATKPPPEAIHETISLTFSQIEWSYAPRFDR